MKRFVVTVCVLSTIGFVGTTAAMIYWLGTELNSTKDELTATREDLDAKDNEIELNVRTYAHALDIIVAADPKLILALLDADLKETENRNFVAVTGSFTDYFVIMLEKARAAGASETEVNSRLDRVLELANQGKYLSSSVRDMHESGLLEQEITGRKAFLAAVRPPAAS